MKKLKSLLHNNKGSGLVTVIVAVSFMSILASLLLVSSYTAYSMKVAEKAGKENYYDATSVLEEVRASLQNVVSDGVSAAYAATMPDYSVSGTGVERKFKKTYQNTIIAYCADPSMAKDPAGDLQLFVPITGSTSYRINPNIIGSLVTDTRKDGATVNLTCGDVVKNEDYSISLHDLTVEYFDGIRKTSISCDITLSCPDITKALTNYAIKGLPNYTVVADKALNISAGAPVVLSGNSYSGKTNIPVGGALTVTNGTMICKTDVNLELSAAKDTAPSFTIAEDASVWASTITVNDRRRVSVLGNTYLANDLVLNGTNAEAAIGGKFFGFGYDEEDSYRSSSIISNAQNTKLELGANLTEMNIAGVAYIGDSTTFDAMTSAYVPMGESISSQANEDAYLAPVDQLSYVSGGMVESNPSVSSEPIVQGSVRLNVEARPEGLSKTFAQYGVKEDVRVVNIAGTNTQKVIYFFLDFDTPEHRSEYFRDYFSKNQSKVDDYIKVTKAANTMFKTKGGYLVTANGYTICNPEENSEKISTLTCDSYNRQFASLCASLSTSFPDFEGFTSEQLYDSRSYLDVGYTPYSVYTQLVDSDALAEQTPNEVLQFYNGSKLRGLVVNAASFTYNDSVDPEGDVNIIICNGDITVSKDFTGVIVSGGSVTVANGITCSSNSVTAAYNGICDNVMVDGEPIKRKISYFFKDFDASSADSNVAWSINELVAISNQKKG